jgi:hypothetical protein
MYREEGPWQAARPCVELRIENLTLNFGGVHALFDVSVDVRDNEILAIIGPKGAGKTALLLQGTENAGFHDRSPDPRLVHSSWACYIILSRISTTLCTHGLHVLFKRSFSLNCLRPSSIVNSQPFSNFRQI